MTALPSFTITGNLLDLLGNVALGEIVGNGLGGATPATITFTSNVPAGYFVTFGGVAYRVDEVTATVSSDGTITRNGDPVQLLANDAGLSVVGLQWQVYASGMKRFWFNAPVDNGTVNLGTVVPVPSLGVSGVAFSAGELITLLADGASPLRVALDALYATIGSTDEYHEYANLAAFPGTGIADRIYVAQDTGKFYHWTGSAYAQIAGNAATALKLFTARNINGVAFDGTADITVVDATKAGKLTKTAIKTADYTAVAYDLVLVDATSANVVITAPTPADGGLFAVKRLDDPNTTGHTVTIITAGSDHFNTTTGPTSLSLKIANHAMLFQYSTSDHVHTVYGDDLPLGGLDTRYLGTIKPGVKGGRVPVLRQRDLPKVDTFNWGGIPITETIDTSGAVTTISSAVTVTMPSASRITPGGGVTLNQDASTGVSAFMFNWRTPDHATGAAQPYPLNGYPNPWGWFVQFDVIGCTEIEFNVYNHNPGAWQLMLDNKWVTPLPRTGGLATSHFNNIKYALPDTGVHRVRFYMNVMALHAIFVNAGATIWARPLVGPRLFGLGDSLTQGGNQDTGGELGSWIWKTAHMLGIEDVWNGGRSSTGYIADATDTSSNYVQRIATDVVPAAPDILVVTSYYNDLTILSQTPTQIATALDSLLAAVAAALPNTFTIIVGSWDPTGGNGSSWTNVDTAMKAKCLTYGVPFVQPTTGSVYDGAGNLVLDGVTTAAPWITSNNKPTLIGADNTHYNDVGKEFFAHRMFDAIRALLPA